MVFIYVCFSLSTPRISSSLSCLVASTGFLLVIAQFRYLHGQLQAVACILAGVEQTKVPAHAGVVVSAGRGLGLGDDVFVVGAAAVGGCLAGVGQHEDHFVEAAEETVQDHSCTVN